MSHVIISINILILLFASLIFFPSVRNEGLEILGIQKVEVYVSSERKATSGAHTAKERYGAGKEALEINPAKGVALLKALANGRGVDYFYRARAVNALMEYYFSVSDEKGKEKFFSGDPWGSFYVKGASEKNAREDFDLAARKAFEWSYSMYPTGLANMQIAWWYVRQIRDEQKLIQTEKSAYLDRVKQKIQEEDAIVAREIQQDMPLSEIVTVSILEGINNATGLYAETKDPQYKIAAIKSYERAMRIDPLRELSVVFHHANVAGQSISLFEDIVSQAPDNGKKARPHLMLAANHDSVKDKKSIKLLKEIAGNSDYSPSDRGLAVQRMGDFYMLGGRDINVAEIIFSSQPYVSLIDTTAVSPVLMGIKGLYEYGLTLAGSEGFLPISHYRIAEWHIGEARNNSALEAGQEEMRISEAKKEALLGDAALGGFFASHPEKSQILYAYWLKGMIWGDIALIEKDEAMKAKAEHAFAKASEITDDDSSVVLQKIWASLYYAMFLRQQYGHARAYDIIAHLRPVAQEEFHNKPVIRFLERLPLAGNEYAALKRDIASLAIYDDSFAYLLKGLGWTL